MIAIEQDVKEVNLCLRQTFKRLELNVNEIWSPAPEDLELENRRLADILDWVHAYQKCPDRAYLEKHGYLYPPVDPGIDPDQDWLTFKRWIRGKSLKWRYTDEVGEIKPVESLSDDDVTRELEKIQCELEKRGVVFDAQHGVPSRVAYLFLQNELLHGEPFEHMAQDGFTCIGCTAYCPGCVQRPWCDLGQENSWLEDDEAGGMVVPESVRPYLEARISDFRFQASDLSDHSDESDMSEKSELSDLRIRERT